jgi:hypothetical protein
MNGRAYMYTDICLGRLKNRGVLGQPILFTFRGINQDITNTKTNCQQFPTH